MKNDFPATATLRYETREVLAGAYKSEAATLLTHVVAVSESLNSERPLCSKVKPDSIADAGSLTDAELASPATCPVCSKRDPRFNRVRS